MEPVLAPPGEHSPVCEQNSQLDETFIIDDDELQKYVNSCLTGDVGEDGELLNPCVRRCSAQSVLSSRVCHAAPCSSW